MITHRPERSRLLREAQVEVLASFDTLSMGEMQRYLALGGVEEDLEAETESLLKRLRGAARERFETFADHHVLQQKREAIFYPLSGRYRIPVGPFRDLLKVEIVGEGERTEVDLDQFYVIDGPPAEIREKRFSALSHPSPVDGIAFTYEVGYTTSSEVPDGIKQCMLKIIADKFEYRTSMESGTNAPRETPEQWEELARKYKPMYLA